MARHYGYYYRQITPGYSEEQDECGGGVISYCRGVASIIFAHARAEWNGQFLKKDMDFITVQFSAQYSFKGCSNDEKY